MTPDARRKRRLAALGTFLAVSIGVLFLLIPFLSGFVSRFVPASVEATIGSQMIDELGKETEFCQGAEGLAALDTLVEALAEQTDGTYEFRVYVADQEVLNAFAAPGGHVVLYRSIIEEAESPNEVAGVLAHEMAHITNGHPARGMVEAMGYGVFRLFTMDESMGAELVKSTVTNHYSREDELEADQDGVALLNQAGFDSRGLLGFFDKLTERGQEIPGALEFLSTHPSGDTRKKALDHHVADGEVALSDDQWQALRSVCKETGSAVYVGPG
ncbi:MAG: M48 family metallopeptidase [bacterium]|nr:M48 family metallopeptidase [bacterium]